MSEVWCNFRDNRVDEDNRAADRDMVVINEIPLRCKFKGLPATSNRASTHECIFDAKERLADIFGIQLAVKKNYGKADYVTSMARGE